MYKTTKGETREANKETRVFSTAPLSKFTAARTTLWQSNICGSEEETEEQVLQGKRAHFKF